MGAEVIFFYERQVELSEVSAHNREFLSVVNFSWFTVIEILNQQAGTIIVFYIYLN